MTEPTSKPGMTLDEFFAEAKRLRLRMPLTHEEMCAAFDIKDARISELSAALMALLDWGREHTSPTQPNSPHKLLVKAAALLEGTDVPTAPTGDEGLRDTIGQAIADKLAEWSEGGEVTFDPFDSRNIDEIADAVVAALPSIRTATSQKAQA